MHAVVLFESMYGNTEQIARAVADGLSSRLPADTVDLVEVGTAPAALGDDVDLLVVGGPTHAFGMSRPKTRADAAKQVGHSVVSAGIGQGEWLEALPAGSGRAVATFDTRVRRPRLPGSAARGAAKRLRALGFRSIARPESFWVSGSSGPLLDGEVGRARRWGEQLASAAAPAAAWEAMRERHLHHIAVDVTAPAAACDDGRHG